MTQAATPPAPDHPGAMTVTLCATCTLGAGGFARTLAGALAEAGIVARIRTVDCLSGCTRPSAIAFRAPGKTAYLFGDVSGDDLAGLLTFARLYQASADGTFTDARPLGALRQKALARIPG